MPQFPSKPTSQPVVVRQESVQLTAWQGPIPPPNVMEAYHRFLPSAPDRILTMAEKHADHNMKMERIGQVCGFILALIIIVGAIWLMAHGQTIGGLTGLVGTVGTFIWLQKRRNPPQQQK